VRRDQISDAKYQRQMFKHFLLKCYTKTLQSSKCNMHRFLATGLPVQLFILAEVQSRPESEASGSLQQVFSAQAWNKTC